MRSKSSILATAFASVAFTAALLTAPTFSEPAEAAVPNCGGAKPTKVGTTGHDLLVGTSGRDVIVGLGGSDTIMGLGYGDLLCGGAGHDVLDGGRGADKLWGDLGNDACYGEKAEHTYHLGCEVHRLAIAQPQPPRTAASSTTTTTRTASTSSTDSVSTSAVSTAGTHAAYGDYWFQYDAPRCERSGVNFGRIYARGDYTSEGKVAIMSMPWRWDKIDGGYDQHSEFNTNWQYYNFGNDGVVRYADLGMQFVGIGSTWKWKHIVWWWNGSSWVDGRTIEIPTYWNGYYSDVCLSH